MNQCPDRWYKTDTHQPKYSAVFIWSLTNTLWNFTILTKFNSVMINSHNFPAQCNLVNKCGFFKILLLPLVLSKEDLIYDIYRRRIKNVHYISYFISFLQNLKIIATFYYTLRSFNGIIGCFLSDTNVFSSLLFFFLQVQ